MCLSKSVLPVQTALTKLKGVPMVCWKEQRMATTT